VTTYYLDTSTLSKRYVQETGTTWVRALTDPTAEHTLLTARITMIEMYSALARRKREGSVPAADCDVAAQAFTAHSATEYDFVELDMGIVTLARDLLNSHPLRAYDAVQLASALVANRALQAVNLPPLVFLSADNRLNAAAAAEGLVVDNPNTYL
jgi:predicted nucleic acid-binding protein